MPVIKIACVVEHRNCIALMMGFRIVTWTHFDFGLFRASCVSIIGRLLPFCRGKRKMVPQVNVSATPPESKNKEELEGFSLIYTCGEKRRIVASGT